MRLRRREDETGPLREQIAALKDQLKNANAMQQKAIFLGVELAAWHLSQLGVTPPGQYRDELRPYAGYIEWVTLANAQYLHAQAAFISRGCMPNERPDSDSEDDPS